MPTNQALDPITLGVVSGALESTHQGNDNDCAEYRAFGHNIHRPRLLDNVDSLVKTRFEEVPAI